MDREPIAMYRYRYFWRAPRIAEKTNSCRITSRACRTRSPPVSRSPWLCRFNSESGGLFARALGLAWMSALTTRFAGSSTKAASSGRRRERTSIPWGVLFFSMPLPPVVREFYPHRIAQNPHGIVAILGHTTGLIWTGRRLGITTPLVLVRRVPGRRQSSGFVNARRGHARLKSSRKRYGPWRSKEK